MPLDFASLKKSRETSLEKLNTQFDAVNSSSFSNDDDKYWKLEVDKAGNGYAIIRFLPAPAGEDAPFVRKFDHGFKGPTGKWYIENSLTTPRPSQPSGENDPVSEYNTKLWNSGVDADKQKARDQKRRLGFFSNIYVVKDTANPENEGKVFLYRYGKKIWDKLNDARNPVYDDEVAVDPFDLWDRGANFKLKARKVEGYRNYDQSGFDSPSTLESMSDEELEEVWKQCHSLTDILDDKNFKSYSELKRKLYDVLALQDNVPSMSEQTVTPMRQMESSPMKESVADDTPFETDDDEMSYFKKLAND